MLKENTSGRQRSIAYVFLQRQLHSRSHHMSKSETSIRGELIIYSKHKTNKHQQQESQDGKHILKYPSHHGQRQGRRASHLSHFL
jgi:hypothetical protein